MEAVPVTRRCRNRESHPHRTRAMRHKQWFTGMYDGKMKKQQHKHCIPPQHHNET
jgi:hypothetical protein